MMRLALALAAVHLGCIGHRHSPTNAPGHVALEQPPKDLALRTPEAPADPGEDVTIVSAAATPLGVGFSRAGTYMPFSVEFAASRHSMATSHRGLVANELLDGALRPNLGLTFLRVFPGKDKVSFGPMFLELQYVGIDKDKLWSGTLALGVATTFRSVGPQATACVGTLLLFNLCARGNYLFGDGAALQLMFGYQGVYESIASR
jgi:hypothetical protein